MVHLLAEHHDQYFVEAWEEEEARKRHDQL